MQNIYVAHFKRLPNVLLTYLNDLNFRLPLKMCLKLNHLKQYVYLKDNCSKRKVQWTRKLDELALMCRSCNLHRQQSVVTSDQAESKLENTAQMFSGTVSTIAHCSNRRTSNWIRARAAFLTYIQIFRYYVSILPDWPPLRWHNWGLTGADKFWNFMEAYYSN